MINETRTTDAMGTGKMGGSPRSKEQQMDQCIAATNPPSRSLPDARGRGNSSLQEENNILIAEAAHDLRNSLTIIRGITYAQRRQLERDGELDRTQVAQGLKHIDAMVVGMEALLSELLDGTRPVSPRALVLLREPVDLAALVWEIVAEHEMLGMSRQICLDAPHPVVGPWDRALVRRVVSNVLSNAIKYSPEGTSISVAVHREDAAAESWAVLTVIDHGLGIPPQDLPSVFDAFYRGQRETDSVPGTGLGLAIVRRIVDEHEGEVAITSAEGSGTSIMIRLPIGDA